MVNVGTFDVWCLIKFNLHIVSFLMNGAPLMSPRRWNSEKMMSSIWFTLGICSVNQLKLPLLSGSVTTIFDSGYQLSTKVGLYFWYANLEKIIKLRILEHLPAEFVR